jgi:hypothetical protein
MSALYEGGSAEKDSSFTMEENNAKDVDAEELSKDKK